MCNGRHKPTSGEPSANPCPHIPIKGLSGDAYLRALVRQIVNQEMKKDAEHQNEG